MKMKKLTALFGSCLFFFVVMCLYMILDQFSSTLVDNNFKKETEQISNSVEDIYRQMDKLEDNLQFSNKAINTLNKKVEDLPGDDITKSKYVNLKPHSMNKKVESSIEICRFSDAPNGQSADITMLDVFDKMPFDNIDGGVWKQGWDVNYKKNAFDKKRLLVFVMPHSHNDPGWLKTVEEYFRDQTIKIISNVVDALAKDEKRKFIWAESSYAAMWWERASPAKKRLFQEQVRNGQLEIVTGGWVMNDEANTHYFNMLDQMVEGHQWLEKHVGVKPKNGWAIDPFGYSPTMAYLLKRMGFETMLIQRVHYRVKKYLAEGKNLEFMWRQNWDHSQTADIFTHLMPFYSYDVPHTCGPDPKICCQFDFKRLVGGGVSCPWHVAPKEITDENVQERSELLLDQYRKKSQLYRSNVVLAPLGDDFRYDKTFEVLAQFANYERIMEYVNSHPELNAEIRFGTLKDYYQAVADREEVKPGAKPSSFKTLSGDFFTYADRDNHYWSGYYSSRSFFKHMDRELAGYLRAAEIAFSLALAHGRSVEKFPEHTLYPQLLSARKELALFQHHDGVTGTAKPHVVNDYGKRMFNSIHSCAQVMQTSLNFLLTNKKETFVDSMTGLPVFQITDSRVDFDSLPVPTLIIVAKERKPIVFYNSLAQERLQTVVLHVSEPHVLVEDAHGNIVAHQVSLLWKNGRVAHVSKYELSFVATVPALGLTKYMVSKTTESEALAKVTTYNINLEKYNDEFLVEAGKNKQIHIKNDHLQAVFDAESGLLTDLSADGVVLKKMQIRFMKYGTVSNIHRSGAYLFLPDGEAMSLDQNNLEVTVTKGNIYSEVLTRLEHVKHRVRIYHNDALEAYSLDIQNILDIRKTQNFELVMRVESGIQNINRVFFTDLNGFQMQKRKTLEKLPLQANFYPAPAMVFLQDKKSRLTLQTQQANGVASMEQGYIEVVLDRRLNQDDQRGLGEGILDNRVTLSSFRLLLENFKEDNVNESSTSATAYSSVLSNILSHQFQYPLYSFSVAVSMPQDHFKPFYSALKIPLPCDFHIVNFRTLQDNIRELPSQTSALFLHRLAYDCKFNRTCPSKKIKFGELFAPLHIGEITETTLSLMHANYKLSLLSNINVAPMEIQAYKIKFQD